MLPYCNFPAGQKCQMKAAIVTYLWSARFNVKVLCLHDRGLDPADAALTKLLLDITATSLI